MLQVADNSACTYTYMCIQMYCMYKFRCPLCVKMRKRSLTLTAKRHALHNNPDLKAFSRRKKSTYLQYAEIRLWGTTSFTHMVTFEDLRSSSCHLHELMTIKSILKMVSSCILHQGLSIGTWWHVKSLTVPREIKFQCRKDSKIKKALFP